MYVNCVRSVIVSDEAQLEFRIGRGVAERRDHHKAGHPSYSDWNLSLGRPIDVEVNRDEKGCPCNAGDNAVY